MSVKFYGEAEIDFDTEATLEQARRGGYLAVKYGLCIHEMTALLVEIDMETTMASYGRPLEAGEDYMSELKSVLSALKEPLDRLINYEARHFVRFVDFVRLIDLPMNYLLTMAGFLKNVRTIKRLFLHDKPRALRAATLQSLLGYLGQFWFDHGDEWPTGEFVETEKGLAAEPGTAIDFMVEVLDLAGWDFTAEEIRDALPTMRGNIGMTGALEAEDDEDEND